MKKKVSSSIYDGLIVTIILIAIVVSLIPVLHLLAVSLSSNNEIIKRNIFIFPKEVSFKAYQQVFQDITMLYSLGYTAFLTALTTVISIILTILAAYPLTRKRMIGRKTIMTIIIFTMYFSGGIIPDYLLMQRLNLIDKLWVLVLPGAVSVFNMIILKSFFLSIPQSLEESAFLDGATDYSILTKIFLPLSKPVLATLILFYAVGRWNGFQDALLYISNSKLQPIQLKLYQIVNNLASMAITQQEGMQLGLDIAPDGMKAACVMFATVPILLVYPWLQKYFITGVMMGAIKE